MDIYVVLKLKSIIIFTRIQKDRKCGSTTLSTTSMAKSTSNTQPSHRCCKIAPRDLLDVQLLRARRYCSGEEERRSDRQSERVYSLHPQDPRIEASHPQMPGSTKPSIIRYGAFY